MSLLACSCRANTGLKGEDFNRNLYIKTLDFATIHVYPQSFGLSNTSFQNVNEFYVGEHDPPPDAAVYLRMLHVMALQYTCCWHVIRAGPASC